MDSQKKTTMSIIEMGRQLGIKKTDSYWLVHKECHKLEPKSFDLIDESTQEAALLIGVSQREVYRMTENNLPESKRGGGLHFRKGREGLSYIETGKRIKPIDLIGKRI